MSSLKYIFNIRDWIAPCLDEIKYHTTPHVFLFRREEDRGKAVMYYKHWSSEPWIPKEGLILLKVYINCTDFTSYILYSINVNYCALQEMPTGYPSLVEPNLEKIDLPHLCTDIRKYKKRWCSWRSLL